MKALRRFTVRAHLPERLSALARLSINLRWSWDKPTQHLFEAIADFQTRERRFGRSD